MDCCEKDYNKDGKAKIDRVRWRDMGLKKFSIASVVQIPPHGSRLYVEKELKYQDETTEKRTTDGMALNDHGDEACCWSYAADKLRAFAGDGRRYTYRNSKVNEPLKKTIKGIIQVNQQAGMTNTMNGLTSCSLAIDERRVLGAGRQSPPAAFGPRDYKLTVLEALRLFRPLQAPVGNVLSPRTVLYILQYCIGSNL